MKVYKCQKCNFVTKEYQKTCPLCNNIMEKKVEDLNFNCSLPTRFSDDNRNVKFGYYCYKCKNITANAVCLHCNVKSYLALTYYDRTVVLNYIDSLSEEFTDEEITDILSQLTFEEKNYIYHNMASSYRMLYRRDKVKAFVCILMGLVMLYLGLEIGLGNQDKLAISYFALAFGGGCFTVFMKLGVLYFFDAATVEYTHFPGTVGIITGIIETVYVLCAFILAFSIKYALIFGLAAALLALVINIVYYYIVRKII